MGKKPTLTQRVEMLETAMGQLSHVVKMHHMVLEQAAADVKAHEDVKLSDAGIEQARSNETHPADGFPPNCS